jgi:hypothetical protein
MWTPDGSGAATSVFAGGKWAWRGSRESFQAPKLVQKTDCREV